MKSLSHFALSVLFALLFISCTTGRAQTATPTEALQPTQVIRETPTQTPTITPTATEAGPKQGDTLIENGYTYTYMVIRSPEANEVLHTGFFREFGNFDILPFPIGFYIPDGIGGWTKPSTTGAAPWTNKITG